MDRLPDITTARIFFIIAREANKAVVFRKGPRKWTQMSVWNLDDDTIEFGQWSKVKLRPRRCDLSPSGEYLVYLDDRFEDGDSATSISKPPYWTTLCKWKHYAPLFGSGGGLFKSETELQLNSLSTNTKEFEGTLPSFIKTIDSVWGKANKKYNLWKGHINPILEIRLKRDGWKEIEDKTFVEAETLGKVTREPSEFWAELRPNSTKPMEPQLLEKKITNSSFLWMITYFHSDYNRMLNTFFIKKRDVKTKLDGITWADIDHNGRIIGTKEGQLYASKIFKDGSVQLSNLELICDLNAQQPERMNTPVDKTVWTKK